MGTPKKGTQNSGKPTNQVDKKIEEALKKAVHIVLLIRGLGFRGSGV